MDVAGRYWITLTRDLYICTPHCLFHCKHETFSTFRTSTCLALHCVTYSTTNTEFLKKLFHFLL
jgi:hypothetical protein